MGILHSQLLASVGIILFLVLVFFLNYYGNFTLSIIS